MTPADTHEESAPKRRRVSDLAAMALAASGAVLLLYGAVLALQSRFASWGLAKAAGQVVRVVTAQSEGRSAPVVSFTDAAGKSHTVLVAQAPQSMRYAAGDAVDVLYDAREPSQARITGFAQTFVFPLLLATAGALLLFVAATMSEPPERLRLLTQRGVRNETDPARLQYHPFNAVAVKHYLGEAGAPDDVRKVKITDAAQALVQGRIPVGLAEFSSYMSAIAYLPEAAHYLAKHCPRVRKSAQFDVPGARAVAFLFEGHGVIAISETRAVRLVSQMRGLLSSRAGARAFVPADTVWDAVARNRAAAEAWHALREGVEGWVKDAVPARPQFDEEGVKVPFILCGHGLGGAMAALAAYEFAKRGRAISSVVTFGAPAAGGKAFVEEYRELGLDARTIDVLAARPALPFLRWPLAAPPAGTHWRIPPDGIREAAAAGGWQGGGGLARFAHRLLQREEARGLDQNRSVITALSLRVLASFETARIAMLRHDLERRYALPLSTMMARRLSDLLGAEKAAGALEQAISDHLLDIRGVRPGDAHEAFLTLDDLPRISRAAAST